MHMVIFFSTVRFWFHPKLIFPSQNSSLLISDLSFPSNLFLSVPTYSRPSPSTTRFTPSPMFFRISLFSSIHPKSPTIHSISSIVCKSPTIFAHVCMHLLHYLFAPLSSHYLHTSRYHSFFILIPLPLISLVTNLHPISSDPFSINLISSISSYPSSCLLCVCLSSCFNWAHIFSSGCKVPSISNIKIHSFPLLHRGSNLESSE